MSEAEARLLKRNVPRREAPKGSRGSSVRRRVKHHQALPTYRTTAGGLRSGSPGGRFEQGEPAPVSVAVWGELCCVVLRHPEP